MKGSPASINLSRFEILAAAFLFSTGGAAIKATTLSGWQVASFRSGVAAVAILLLLPGSRRNWSLRTLLVGMAYSATLVLFVLANKLTTSASAIFLQGTAPLYVLLLGPWLLREPVRKSDLVVAAILAIGLSMFFIGAQQPFRTAPDPAAGNVIGAFAGLAWAFTLVGLRWISTEPHSGLSAVIVGNLLAFVIGLPFALPVKHAVATDWLLLLYLGVFQVGLSYVCLTRGLRRLPALEASLLLLAEPALNPVWSWLAHGERPAALALAGGGLILAGTAARMLGRTPTSADPAS